MEPEGSLPRSQQPATCPYPEPARYSLCPPPHILKSHLNIPPIYTWVLQVVSFLQASQLKPCMYLSSPQYVLRTPSILSIFILSPE
jgi:hypothetical protein